MQYGSMGRYSGENIGFGYKLSPMDFIVNLFIDDGVANRGHRKALFNTAWKITGIATCPHGK